jgi:hypothetical protein
MTKQDFSRGRALGATALAALVTATVLVAQAIAKAPAQPAGQSHVTASAPPRIEVAFVLDTTGSMAGLIEGAKHKVWSIANQMASARQQTDVRLALIGYRDRGDAYVTRRFDLSSDVDALYAELQQYRAEGGGDTPESVNQALHEAVTALGWSTESNVYRVIFLVGDAPPHLDYQDDVEFEDSLRLARQKGIAVNTIQCGALAETTPIWRRIATLGGGDYAAIAQDGGMLALATPLDDEFARLNRELADTALGYGDARAHAELAMKVDNARAAPAAAAADRLAYLGRAGGALVSGAKDLVDAVKGGLTLESVPVEELPAQMREMSAPERQAFVETKQGERAQLQARIGSLAKQRDGWLAKEESRLRDAGRADGFDQKVFDAIKRQAAAQGIDYE